MRSSRWYMGLWRRFHWLWPRFSWLPLPRFPHAKPTSPNFLFSQPPYVEWSGYSWYLVLGPNGRDDTPRMVAASERLTAVGGGVMRMKPGQFIVIDEVVWFTKRLKVSLIPEGATVTQFDDVIDVDLIGKAHISGAAEGGAASTVTSDDSSS